MEGRWVARTRGKPRDRHRQQFVWLISHRRGLNSWTSPLGGSFHCLTHKYSSAHHRQELNVFPQSVLTTNILKRLLYIRLNILKKREFLRTWNMWMDFMCACMYVYVKSIAVKCHTETEVKCHTETEVKCHTETEVKRNIRDIQMGKQSGSGKKERERGRERVSEWERESSRWIKRKMEWKNTVQDKNRWRN